MASSDDEGDTCPDAVSDYYFYDGEDEPLSFSKLAVHWNENETSSAKAGPIFLRGTADNGLQKFHQQVKAWKCDFSTDLPEISVLSKENHWIKLQKPRKSYETVIRTIMITVHCLCFLKSKPEASGKTLWDHLYKVFSLYDVRPSENDLIDHMNFIREAVKRDETLAKSKFLAAFLENPRKRKISDEDVGTATKPSFIVDDMNGEVEDDDFITKPTEDSESDDEDDHFDSVCAICDNGGVLTCCEGKCFRSFHATKDSEEAQDSKCESLCLTPEVLKGTQQFKCENCLYSLHQCFVCELLGSSDRSSNPEVFRCSSATCGHFYHPGCVAELLQKDDRADQQVLKEKIAAGEPFICPAHKCAACKQTENEKVEDLQFAICRRCPISYHRKCLPRGIMFEDQIGDDDTIRAWDGLLSKSRALIYCLDHEILEEFGTPARNLIFRNVLQRRKRQQAEPPRNKKKVANSEFTLKKKSVLKSQKGVEKSSASKPEVSSKKRAASVSSGSEPLKKRKVADTSKDSVKRNLSTKVKKPSSNDGQSSLGSRLFDYMQKGTESNNSEKDDTTADDNKQIMADNSLQTEVLPPIDDDSKQRILELMKDAASSITLDEIKKYHKGKVPSTHAHSSRVDKSIILARVEGSVEALHVALKKLEEGCSVEDAMAVCEPAVIEQILRWKEKLRVYLAPFLHGMRYTSFGRHFTKVEKLEKIVDKLHWYIEDGDMVVDFCCGANDFSCLIKKRLDEIGKKSCSYKNYDITRPKNDFNFEKRDWMTVGPKELPSGSQLIMGLNPPFGKNASLANQFIDSALRFKPKLLVLIVPPETERLDSQNKRTPYDLLWEDVELLAGKSFYLPGSVDVNEKQMDQWNTTTPPLYLWSRPDWTKKHKSIAQQHGHTSQLEEAPNNDETVPPSGLPNVSNEVIEPDLSVPLDNPPVINKDPEQTTDKAKPVIKKAKKENPPRDNSIGGTETKTEKNDKKPNQNSSKKNRNNQELKVEKHDKKQSPAPSHQECDDKNSRASSRQDQAKKLDEKNSRVPPSREDQASKFDETHSRAPSRENQAQKLDEKYSRVPPSREDQAQKLDEKYSRVPSSREDQTQKFDETLSRAPSRENQSQKYDEKHSRPPSREAQKYDEKYSQAHKHDEKHYPASRENQAQKYEEKYSRAPSREEQAQKLDDKRSSVPTRENQAHDILNSDFSFAIDVDQPFDQHLERRYNSITDESVFSLQNDIGQPFDQHLERRYNPATIEEPPYNMGSSLYGTNIATSSYSMRPDPIQYSGYDRVGRASYFDEMSTRGSSNNNSYQMPHHEPGLNRYGPVDTTPSNRTSTTAMQRYAPRLDELNHTRIRPELDELSHIGMNNMGRAEPSLASRGMGGYGPPLHGPPGFRMDPLGFAPGPYHPYSQHNSSGGWLNE